MSPSSACAQQVRFDRATQVYRWNREARVASALRCAAVAILVAAVCTSAQAQDPNDGYDARTDGDVRAIVVLADGSSLLGGSFTTVNNQPCPNLCRVTIDGKVAVGQSPLGANDSVNVLRRLADGRIMVGGRFTSLFGQPRFRLARLSADGSFDAGFTVNFDGPVNAIIEQANRGVLIGGAFSGLGGTGGSSGSQRVARLRADGSVDPGYFALLNGVVLALAELDDGRVLAGGLFTSASGQPAQNLVRLTRSGALENAASLAANGAIHALTRDIDGTIMIGGAFTQLAGARQRLARMVPDGSFIYGLANANARVLGIERLRDGRILIGGEFTSVGGVATAGLARLDADRDADPTFRVGITDSVLAIAEQSDGSVLIGGGFNSPVGFPGGHIVRIDSDTSVDWHFNPGANELVVTTPAQRDGRIIAGGLFTQLAGVPRAGLARLFADGRVDGTFTPGPHVEVGTITIDSEDRILLAGRLGGSGGDELVRLLPNGANDSTFSANVSSDVTSIIEREDGGILIGGRFDRVDSIPRPGVARLFEDGSVDPAFRVERAANVQQIFELPSGKILVGGDLVDTDGSIVRRGIFRVMPDGELDPAFDAAYDDEAFVRKLLVQADGRIVFCVEREGSDYILERRHANGELDASFGATLDGSVAAMALRTDGMLAIGGEFSTVNGEPRANFAMLLPDGNLSNLATPAIDGAVLSIRIQNDGKLLLGGAFTTIGTEARARLARLSAPEAALYSFVGSSTGLIWERRGAAPELVVAPWLMLSGDGFDYARETRMSRVEFGWAAPALAQPDVEQWQWLRVEEIQDNGSANGNGLSDRGVLRFRPERVFASNFE